MKTEAFFGQHAHELLQAILIAMLVTIAHSEVSLAGTADAQDAEIPACAMNPPGPSREISVPGLPNQRLYIQRKHPRICTDISDKECKPDAYVISGDKLDVSASCASWSYVEFHGKTTTTGWAPSARLATGDGLPPVTYAESLTASKHPACLQAETLLNGDLRNGRVLQLPSALSTPPTPQGPLESSSTVYDVDIRGQALKATRNEEGGSCAMSTLILWKPKSHKSIPVAGSNAELDQAWAEGDDLVRLRGETYFLHVTRTDYRLARFNSDLSTSPLCEIARYPTRHEATSFASEPRVCRVVLAGHVPDAPIYDVEPADVSGPALAASVNNGNDYDHYPRWQLVSRGRLDIDNDGQADDVGIISYNEDSGAGCGHKYSASRVIKLNAQGVPEEHSAFNKASLEDAERSNTSVRIFQYLGTTYLEYLSADNTEGTPLHEVWKYSTDGQSKICAFVPVRYRATDIPN